MQPAELPVGIMSGLASMLPGCGSDLILLLVGESVSALMLAALASLPLLGRPFRCVCLWLPACVHVPGRMCELLLTEFQNHCSIEK